MKQTQRSIKSLIGRRPSMIKITNTINHTARSKANSSKRLWNYFQNSDKALLKQQQYRNKIKLQEQERQAKKQYKRKKRIYINRFNQMYLSVTQSDKIIQLFEIDGGNYIQIAKQLKIWVESAKYQEMKKQHTPIIVKRWRKAVKLDDPNIRLHPQIVREHIKKLAQFALQRIIGVAKQFYPVRQWDTLQTADILRELMRIRSSNRLLSQADIKFREIFMALLRSKNHPQTEIQNQSIFYIQKRLTQYARGSYDHSERQRDIEGIVWRGQSRHTFAKERIPLKCGGRLFNLRVKKEEILFQDKIEEGKNSQVIKQEKESIKSQIRIIQE